MLHVVTVSDTVCVHVKGLKNVWYRLPIGYSAGLNPKNTHILHLSWHAEFSPSRSKPIGLWASVRVPKMRGWAPASLSSGVSEPIEAHPFLSCVTSPNLIAQSQTAQASVADPNNLGALCLRSFMTGCV